MPNSYFQFKQFLIRQDRCSMKVCTDSCLFGSLLPVTFMKKPITDVLDIGTGTGLLSLMYAQKNPGARIDAIEIEENAFQQAKVNFEASPWNDRLRIFHSDIKNFTPPKIYDLIICNPPFFENDVSSSQKNKNIAMHNAGLKFEDLIETSLKFLNENGCLSVLLPYHRVNYFTGIARKNNLYVNDEILAKQTPSHNYFRGILLLSKIDGAEKKNELIIKNNEGYTYEFKKLLKDYYLN